MVTARLSVDSSGIGSFAVKSMKSLAPLKTSIFVYGKHSTLTRSPIRCEKWGLIRDDRNTKIGFKTPGGDWFFIDYIFNENFGPGAQLSIDLDVNSFAVSPDLGLHKREYLNRPLCKTYGNIKNKVAYLIKNNPCDGQCGYMKERVAKMEGRGWKVIRSQSLHDNCAQKI